MWKRQRISVTSSRPQHGSEQGERATRLHKGYADAAFWITAGSHQEIGSSPGPEPLLELERFQAAVRNQDSRESISIVSPRRLGCSMSQSIEPSIKRCYESLCPRLHTRTRYQRSDFKLLKAEKRKDQTITTNSRWRTSPISMDLMVELIVSTTLVPAELALWQQ